jgi:hypothetical protein
LATSGAAEAILWPFTGKNGPMGQKPLMVAGGINGEARVTQVACHPTTPVVLTGYNDGTILMARLPDGAEVLIRAPSSEAISALSWRKDGKAMAFGTENGTYGGLVI